MIETNIEKIKSNMLILLNIDINETDFSPVIISHPFANSGFQHIDNKLLNIVDNPEDKYIWQQFLKQKIKNAILLYDLYLMINKPYKLYFVYKNQDYLSEQDFAELLADAYISSEAPNMDVSVSLSKLKKMFEKANKNYLMSQEEQKFLENKFKNRDTIKIYRGVTNHNKSNYNKALSWTTDLKTAKWFANRFSEDGYVYSAEIKKENIYAVFLGRNEKEIILNPKYLMNIKQIYG